MSKQGTIMIRLLFIFVAATFLIAVGGGVFAQNTDDAGSSQADLAVPTSTSDRARRVSTFSHRPTHQRSQFGMTRHKRQGRRETPRNG